MIKIKVPDTSNGSVSVGIGGKIFTFNFRYNNLVKKPGNWYLDIDYNGERLISSLKLIENVPLLRKYAISELSDFDLMVVMMKETTEPCSRDNLGFDKPYELVCYEV